MAQRTALVLVKKCSSKDQWYRKKIGRKFRLAQELYDCYRVSVGKGKPHYYIFKGDAELIEPKPREKDKKTYQKVQNYNHPKGNTLYVRRDKDLPGRIHWVEQNKKGELVDRGFISRRKLAALSKHKF